MSAEQRFLGNARPSVSFERMEIRHIKDVLAIETDVFPFPWGYGSFIGCLSNGYECWLTYDETHAMIGYFIVMKVVDEAHLLTIAVRGSSQGKGFGLAMLEKVIEVARELETDTIFLEVRPSNPRAIDLYGRMGFREIGRRKNYYTAEENTREDAIMMTLPL